MGRWIGVDYGTKRIGIAIADHGGTLASPVTTLPASGRAVEDADRILKWARGQEPVGFVVGLPVNMDGTTGPQARLSQEFARELETRGGLPVRLWDERLSSFAADQLLIEAEVRRARRKRLRDALAAQVILQSFLDAHRHEAPPQPGQTESPD